MPIMKPAAHAEKQIMDAILEGRWPPGTSLPAERILSQELGITRPTLRETLHRLAREGWVTIAHGKPTRVNDYLSSGGLGILSTLARYGGNLSSEMVKSLLDARIILLPPIAQRAAQTHPQILLEFLNCSPENTPEALAEYDWALQLTMVRGADNPILNLMFNDFTPMYARWCVPYFQDKGVRRRSLDYYADLICALENKEPVAPLVASAMEYARGQWP